MRKYSDKFIDSEINKIDKIYAETQTYTPLSPDLSDRPFLQKQLNNYIEHRKKVSYIQGFWYGWSLRNGMKEEKEKNS